MSATTANPRNLIIASDSDSDSDSDSETSFHSAKETPPAAFTINKEYARRFEHNKKREELQRLEEKYGKDTAAGSDKDTDSEEEDDNAVLATLELDREINATLAAIRRKDPRVYDGKTTFYNATSDDDAEQDDKPKPEKPITLKDYHLRNLLSGSTPGEDATPKTFVQEQADLKRTVVKEMHAAAADNSDDDDEAFLTRKPKPAADPEDAPPPLPDLSLAERNPDEFLTQFLSSRAWAASAPTPGLLDDDSDEEETAEAFERAYNFRFENPNVEARGTLVSYSRDAVSTNTVRREDKSARKLARERKRERREKEAEERTREMGRLRKLKMDELMQKVKVLQEAAGIEGEEGEEADADALDRVLEGEFTEEGIDEYINRRFGKEYYEGGKADKPVFDDDIDIDDIVPGFDKEAGTGLADDDDEDDDETGGAALEAEAEAEAETATPAKRSTKKESKLADRKRKQQDKDLKRKLSQYVDDTYDFEARLPPPPPSGGGARGFRYRETTPEAYGLTSLDILAATDQDLNGFVGLKRLAAFRDPEKKRRDRRRYGKKRRLREWRREVFGHEAGAGQGAGEGQGHGEGQGEGQGGRGKRRK